MLLLGIYRDTEGKRHENLYYSWESWHEDTFSPATEIYINLLFEVKGKTYAEKKANLEQLAKDFQCLDEGGLSYGELFDIQYFFEKNAKRYGLLREFKENGII